MTTGFATPEGTERMAQRHANDPLIASGHYREPFAGLRLSSLGMGTYLGDPDDATDRLVADAAVRSVESGAINVLDTAINYRYQKAERALRDAIARLQEKGIARDELFVSTKNGFLTPDADVPLNFRDYFQQEFIRKGIVTPEDLAGGMHCMTPRYLEDQLHRSLTNLGLESIDLMYLHNAAESQIPAVGHVEFMRRLEEAFRFYEGARRENKIRYYGLATWDCFRVPPLESTHISLEAVVALAQKAGGEEHGFRFIQLPFNLAFPEAGSMDTQEVAGHRMSALEAAARLGIGVFTSVPLLQGRLLDERLPEFDGLQTPAQSCLQIARSHPGILAPLIGQKTPAHVAENLKVASVPPLTSDQLNRKLAAV